MMMRHNVVGGTPFHIVNDIFLAELFLQIAHCLQDNQQGISGFNLHLGMETVVAIMAVIVGIFFAKIMQQHATSADGRLGIGSRLL